MSADTFEVGEVAVYNRPGHQCHGRDVTIRSPLQQDVVQNRSGRRFRVRHYDIDMAGMTPPVGTTFVATPEQLRKRRPPQDWKQLCRLQDVPADKPTCEVA